jgi:hypothetical protein
MGVFEAWLTLAFLLVIMVAGWRVMAYRPEALPTDPPAPERLLSAKRQFITELNRRIAQEPQVALQLQTLRDMVVGWYELKGSVSGVRFVARACCESCYQLDGRQFSLLDVRQLVRLVPPVHREQGLKRDCCCTLMPITVGRGSRPHEKGAVRSTRPLLR